MKYDNIFSFNIRRKCFKKNLKTIKKKAQKTVFIVLNKTSITNLKRFQNLRVFEKKYSKTCICHETLLSLHRGGRDKLQIK